ncbi:MAG: carboxypeptidase-like regulatory domain-containing protein [Bacteroidales bacterium]|nr:carboxypeptidase-like regulatory domain-containing protein [Bacteroidales bacterium]
MKKAITIIILLFVGIFQAKAQTDNIIEGDSLLRISGKVISVATGEFLRDADVHVLEGNVSTMTNEDGYFLIKCPKDTKALTVSALGHKQNIIDVRKLKSYKDITVLLQPNATILENVLVYSADNIVLSALDKIVVNYPSQAMMYRTFYRETVKKKRRYVCVIEAVQDVYKKPYSFDNPEYDKVFVEKGRRLLSEHRKDTIAVHVEGGPNEVLFLDLVKHRGFFLNKDMLSFYEFSLDNAVYIADRLQYVVKFRPNKEGYLEYAYSGTMYIDIATLSFTRLELDFDCTDKDKASAFMLRHKPFGLRFKPISLKTVINYYFDGQKSHINYTRNEFHFGCDWKKHGFYTQYTVTSENLVTNREVAPDKAPRRPSFGKYEVLDKKVSNFTDEEFWKDYNILEPSESLENAVKKLMKRANDNPNEK